jgi:hypothetical protein
VLVNPATGTRYVQMNKGLKAAMRRAKVEDLRWHDLRRTAGCRWLQRDGKSLEEVSILLGHSSVMVTKKSPAAAVGIELGFRSALVCGHVRSQGWILLVAWPGHPGVRRA